MDKWKAKEIKIMELGGNKKAHAFYAKNGMLGDGRPNHENPALSKYKMALQKQALAALGEEKPSVSAPVTPQESVVTKEEEKKDDPFEMDFSAAPKVAAAVSTDAPSSSSVYSFTNLKQNNQPVNLHAKKLDVDFGNDDFFDSFGTSNQPSQPAQAKANDNPFAVAEPAADEAGPFQLGSGVGSKAKNAENDEFVKSKLKELQGKKGISSEDFKQMENDEYKDRLKQFNGATAISSADFFGENRKSETSDQGRASLNSFGRDSFGDKVSEAAIYAADAVANNAKKLKEKAANFWAGFGRPSE